MRSGSRQAASHYRPAACAPQKQNASATFFCTISLVAQHSLSDSVRSSPARLCGRHGDSAKGTCRSRRYVTAVQSRHPLREVLRPARSTIVFELVPKVGGGNLSHPQTERLIVSEYRLRAIKPDAAARDRV